MSISDSCSVPLSVRSETREKFDALLKAAKRRKTKKNHHTKSKENLIRNDDESIPSEDDETATSLNRNYILNKFLDESISLKSPEHKKNESSSANCTKPPVPIPRKSKQNKETFAAKPSPTGSQATFAVMSPKIVKNLQEDPTITCNKVSSNSSDASDRTYNVNTANKIGDIVVHTISRQKNESHFEKVVAIINNSSQTSSFVEKGDVETLSDNESDKTVEDLTCSEEKEIEKTGESFAMKEIRKSSLETMTIPKSNGKYSYDRIIQVIIHKTDRLLLNSILVHPLVKMHIVDIDTGKYFQKSDASRPVVFFYESDDCGYISPVMTHPFNLQDQRSILPRWEESILLNEDFDYFLERREKMIIFFEILDFLPYSVMQQTNQFDGWHHVAFSFLKMSNKEALKGEKTLRLQLYYPPRKDMLKTSSQSCPLWLFWSKSGGKLRKYPSTIYITLSSILSPGSMPESFRSKTPIQRETGSKTIQCLFGNNKKSEHDNDNEEIISGTNNKDGMRAQHNINNSNKTEIENFMWTRKARDICKIPNKFHGKFDCGDDGCFIMKFSNDGKHLACSVLCNNNLYCIMIISVVSMKQTVKIPVHQSLIYSIKWSIDDSLILTASADNTISILDFNSNSLLQILPHPSFVYCCDISSDQMIIISGCCDKMLRIWNRSMDNSKLQYDLHQELEGHRGYITSSCFNKKSNVYSADSLGLILEWEKTDEHDWKLLREIQILDLKETVINQILLFGNDKRMLIHSRDSTLRIIDVKTCCVLQWLRGSLNRSVQTSCTLTPCGKYAFAGSENGIVKCWSTKTGQEVSLLKPYQSKKKSPRIHCVDFHPCDNIIAIANYGEGLPVVLFIYDDNVAESERAIERKEHKEESMSGGDNKSKLHELVKKSFRSQQANSYKYDLKSVLNKMDQVIFTQNNESSTK